MGIAKDNLELLEERQKDLVEQLNRMAIDDPKRPKVQDELDLISKIIVNMKTQDETRLNNNARNSIEEERLRIEHKKLESDKIWRGITIGTSVLGVASGYLMQCKSYHMEEANYAFKALKNFGERTLESFSNLRFWRR